jgi:hypothetical protein
MFRLFGRQMMTTTVAIVVLVLRWPRRSLDDRATRVRRARNFLWQSAGPGLTARSQEWLVQKALAVFRGLLEDLAPTFAVHDVVRFGKAVARLEEARRHLAAAGGHRSRGDAVAATASLARVRSAVDAGLSLLPSGQ